MRVRLGAASYLAVSLLALVLTIPARAQEIVHGANSLFVSPTLKIAWAAQKGVSEEATAVIIRVVNSSGAYQQVRLEGVDPFSKQRAALVATQPHATQVDLIVSRARFAEYPSCEIQLYRSEAVAADQRPSVTVFYLGVPDTTPEFTTAQAMDEYFAKILGSTKSR